MKLDYILPRTVYSLNSNKNICVYGGVIKKNIYLNIKSRF